MEQENNSQEQKTQEATTVGMFLKFTRQNQKKSIETVSKALCIRKIYIKAIEESDFNELPPVPYGIGFIRSYADFLGLNSERIVQCYKEEAMPKKNEGNLKPIVKKHTPLTMPNKKQILIGLCLVLGLYILTIIGYDNTKNNLNDTNIISAEEVLETTVDNNINQISEEQNVTKNIINEEIDDTVKMVEESYPETKTDAESTETLIIDEPKNKIVVKFNGESWFEVKDDKKVYIRGIYQKGFEYEIPDVPNLIFSVGRYFNVDVFINDELVKVAGPKKQTNIKLDEFLNH